MRAIQVIQRVQRRGAELAAIDLANEWLRNGHEVLVITLFSTQGSLPFHGRLVCLNANEGNRLFDLGGYRKLAKLIRNFGADVVIANAADTLKYCVLSKVLYLWKAKLVFRNASTMSAYIRHPLVRYFNAMLLSQVNLVLSVSQHSANDIQRLFPGMNTKTKVVYNGIDLKKFEIVRRVNRSGEVNVLHIGGFTFEKNHEGLFRIFSQFRNKYPGARLHLVGDGPLRPRIQLLVSEQCLSGAVVFHGWISRVEEMLAFADMIVLPSLLEGLPTVIVEAFAARVPVVANRVGGVDELVRPGITGFLVSTDDEEGFVEAMIMAMQLPDNTMVDCAYQVAQESFNIVMSANSFMTLLGKCVKYE